MITRCRECGSDVETKAFHSVICEECKEENRRIRDHARYLKRRVLSMDPDALLIVNDPDPFGFHKGAVINRYEIVCMCRKKYQSFTLGTILKDFRGQHFEVIGLPDGNQKLIRHGT
jgi:hypothetical protein